MCRGLCGREVAAPSLATPDPLPHARFCHQLDFSTSGALCVALNKAAAGSAYKCFKERRVTKAYLALVRPDLCPRQGVPQKWWVAPRIACDPSAWQVRGHVQESRMTINYAIGRNSTEGRAHTMCIEGTQGTQGRGWGLFGVGDIPGNQSGGGVHWGP